MRAAGGFLAKEGRFRRRGVLRMALALVLMVLVAVPVSTGATPARAAESYTPATFDLYSPFPEQVIAPSRGEACTSMQVEVRNISGPGGIVSLTASCDSPYFSACPVPCIVIPLGASGSYRTTVKVNCAPNTPDGTVCWIKVNARRGAERHYKWLKVTALASHPQLEWSRGQIIAPQLQLLSDMSLERLAALGQDPEALITGQGYQDALLQSFTGQPLRWHMEATNLGGTDDTYALGFEASFPCQVTFRDSNNQAVDTVSVNGVTADYCYPKPVFLTAEVLPTGPMPKNQPMDVSFTLGGGRGDISPAALTAQVVNPGELFCMNDMAGLRPHAHQVKPGEETSFIFHVTNLSAASTDMHLTLAADTPGWDVALDRDTIAGLAPGVTEQAVVTVQAPQTAAAGDAEHLTMTCVDGQGRSEQVQVAVEITDVPNVYYWSLDSMDPEYLYMNGAGTGAGSDGDWLMPNLHAFIGESVNYTRAQDYLPSATDMNHTNALAGTYTGTAGVYCVGGTCGGISEHDELKLVANSYNLLRYGEGGQPVQRIFEVAKEETQGKALCGFWTNKNWLAELENGGSVDIVGHSEKWPLFFPPPYQYSSAGDPTSDANAALDPPSCSFLGCMHSSSIEEILLPALLGKMDPVFGLGLYAIPISIYFGLVPGNHAEDRYIANSFFRSVQEEDPDVCYVNLADLDNTGHFTGASFQPSEWNTLGTPWLWDDVNKYSPWLRREECLDIAREADIIFGEFIDLLKRKGVYDNSIIVVLSDHGMENMKDPACGYEFLDLREILRRHGLVLGEDYFETGGTEFNYVWSEDAQKVAAIETILESYQVCDRELGKVNPLVVVDRQETQTGVDLGSRGSIAPGELYSEYWINNPGGTGGHIWPDLFVFPLYNYQMAVHGGALRAVGMDISGNVPEALSVGLPAAHGGAQTQDIPLLFKAPVGCAQYEGGLVCGTNVKISDIAPTIYELLGWPAPKCVDGQPLPAP